jgi:hypothetical protein
VRGAVRNVFNFQGFRHGGENSVKRSILGAFPSSGGHFFKNFGFSPDQDRERCCAKNFSIFKDLGMAVKIL